MRTTLVVHILAGALGLLSGAVALSAAKGARLHRKSGMLFVYAMLTMAVCGTAIAAIRGVAPAVNIPAALMMAYLVITGLITMRPLASRPHLWRMCYALFIAALSFFLGQAKVIPKPVRIPALLALPVLAVLVSMIYWLWRVRIRHNLRGIVVFGAPKAA